MGRNPSWLPILAAYGAVYVIWGSTFLSIRFAVETLPPLLSGGVSYLCAGLILFVWVWLRGKERPTLDGWLNAAKLGFFMILLGYGGVMWAEQVVPSGIAALILSVEPLWFFVLDWLVFKSVPPRLKEWAGLALGFAATVYLAMGQGSDSFETALGYRIGTIVILCSSLGWVIGSLVSRKIHVADSVSLGAGMEMLMGGALLVIVGFALGEGSQFISSKVSLRSCLAMGYFAVFGSVVAFTAFFWLLKVEPASRVATHGFVNPVVAVFLGWALGGEQVTPQMSIAAGMIVIAVMIITMTKKGDEARSVPTELASIEKV